jgi:isopenicillin N synthase-like dioxygenase
VSQDLLHLSPTPVINLGHLSLDDSVTRSGVINQIARACHDLGYFQVRTSLNQDERTLCYTSLFRFPNLRLTAPFLQVTNHGISQSVMDCAVEAASDFFQLPSEAKEQFASQDLRKPVRYDTSSKDSISMSRAFLKHYAHPPRDWIQYWPDKPPIYR